MDRNCILCGKEISRDAEYTGQVGDALLHPVCLECWKFCEKEPARVLAEHRQMIDDILSDYEKHWKAHRFDRVAEPRAEKPSEPRSAETILAKKYNDAYSAAQTTLDCANAFKIIGVVLAVLIIVGGTFVVVSKPELAGNPLAILGGLIVSALVAISFYWCGTLLTGLGRLLFVAAEIAINTSPLLTVEVKAKEMEVPFTPEGRTADAA
jgi:hypothetical protein